MSGPVWKRLHQKGACDSCGETCDERYAVGTVTDFSFRPDAAYCPSCYARYAGRADELNPDAVDHMQAPRTLSRPVSVGDVE
ncbi:MAG: hypothetical protein WCC53_06505 [Thermoanaerobaculia bacterium]|jgi:hypothetical protein